MDPVQKARKLDDTAKPPPAKAEADGDAAGKRDAKPLSDYDKVFLIRGLSKRSTRGAFDPALEPSQAFKDFMTKWFSIALMNANPSRDQERQLINDWPLFDDMVDYHMPPRLDLNNWVGRIMLRCLSKVVKGDPEYHHEFKAWYWGLDTLNEETEAYSSIGQPNPGRIVWVPKDGLNPPTDEETQLLHGAISLKLLEAEKSLVDCAGTIALKIKSKIMSEYVKPESQRQGREVLDEGQINAAVREILGLEWFVLPFDFGGVLPGLVP